MEMKMLKRIIIIAFALVLIFALTACGDGSGSGSSGSGGSLSTKTGVLIEASMHVISIQAPDGTTYTFGIDDNTTINGSELLGNTMSVSYNGEYASGVIAVTITTVTEVDHAGSSGKGSTGETGAPQPKDPPATQETIWYMTGTVVDVSMNHLSLKYEDGKTYSINKDDNTKSDPGIVVGCVARVFHKGSMRDGMLALEVHFISDTPPPSPEDTIWYLTGTVVDATMNGLQLLYEDGKTYSIIIDDNTRMDEGIVVNCIARVFHKGLLADEMHALEIRLIQSPP